jgi:gamma-glutamyltranspeptidase / glutathione hydrolase
VDAKRVHSQWLPDEISPEPGALKDDVAAKLKELGHTITFIDWDFGRVDAILVRENHTLEGGADSRGDDIALGF